MKRASQDDRASQHPTDAFVADMENIVRELLGSILAADALPGSVYLQGVDGEAFARIAHELASTHVACPSSRDDVTLSSTMQLKALDPERSQILVHLQQGSHKQAAQEIIGHLEAHPLTGYVVLLPQSLPGDHLIKRPLWRTVMPALRPGRNATVEMVIGLEECRARFEADELDLPSDLIVILQTVTRTPTANAGVDRTLWHELMLTRMRAAVSEQECGQLLQRQDILTRSLNNASLTAQSSVGALHHASARIEELLRSRSWRLTAPLRAGVMLARRGSNLLRRLRRHAGTSRRVLADRGVSGLLREILEIASSPRRILRLLRHEAASIHLPQYLLPNASPALTELTLRVLIIADMNLAQCTKYRVLQKQQMIQDLGLDCSIVRWEDLDSARDLLNTHTVAIFYRVPGFEVQLESIARAKELGMRTIWEVDDLIFDAELYETNSNLKDLDNRVRTSILNGVPLYRAAMLACDCCIASTQALADAMRACGVSSVHVVNNALDDQTLFIAEEINAQRRRHDGLIRIVYGSGSASHDSDFRECADALLQVLKENYHARLTIVGTLNLPATFKMVESQVERLPPSDYATYLTHLAKCDINIAPLETSVFNDAKSNIKYLEAAIVKLPSICSPTAEFLNTVTHGETGLLARGNAEWKECLTALIEDAPLRARIARKAYEHVLLHYTPNVIAREQVMPVLAPLNRFVRDRPRILGVNIFFEPRSFGGATIVAEEVARRINASGNAQYAMLTSLPCTDVPPYKITRYRSSAAEVFAMGLPFEADPAFDFDNPFSPIAFREILRSWRPDVVHLHSIQGFGVQIAEACQEAGIPYVVTMHDAWWICARQFMITSEGKYCHQSKVDLKICSRCVSNPALNPYRQHRLHEILAEAALMIAPSVFFRGVYADNGFDTSRIVVNKNGVVPPRAPIQRSAPSGRKLRFGFVGGEGPAKGSELIKQVLRELPHTNYELHVVDAALNLGRRHIFEESWQIPGTLKIVPAYTQASIDEFFASVDVLLFPTQCKESFGLTVREAMLRDTWVIATDAGGAVEDIVPGENGDVVPLLNGTALFKASIEQLLEEPGRLDGYRNPHAELIRVFDDQAGELLQYLETVIHQYPPRHALSGIG